MKILHSREGYESAMRQVAELNEACGRAEREGAGKDFFRSKEAIQELTQAAINQREKGMALDPSAHLKLESALKDLSRRTQKISLQPERQSSLKEVLQNLPWQKLAAAAALAAVIGVSCMFSHSQMPPDFKPDFTSNGAGEGPKPFPPPPKPGPVPEPKILDPHPAGNSILDGIVQPANAFNLGATLSGSLSNVDAVRKEKDPIPQAPRVGSLTKDAEDFWPSPFSRAKSTYQAPRCETVSASPKNVSAKVVIAAEPEAVLTGQVAASSKNLVSKVVILPESKAAVEGQVVDPLKNLGSKAVTLPESKTAVEDRIASSSKNLVHLGALLLASNALQGATPFLGALVVNRMYKIARLSNTALLADYVPQYSETLEKAATAFDQFEKAIPISVTRMLENMNSLDRWAAVGLLKMLPRIPGIGVGAGALIPYGGALFRYSWPVLQYTPFFIDAWNLEGGPIPENNTQLQSTSPTLKDHARDIASTAYLLLAASSLKSAAPFLALSATHQVYTILQETRQSGELKETLPLFASLMEKSSKAYETVESFLPFSTGDLLSGLTDIDRWAMIGLMNLVRPRFMRFGGGRIPGAPWLLCDSAWRFLQFTPLLLGRGLTKINEAIGFSSLSKKEIDG